MSGLPQCLTFECSPGPGVSGGLLLLVLIRVDYVETEEQVFKDLFYLGACVSCVLVCVLLPTESRGVGSLELGSQSFVRCLTWVLDIELNSSAGAVAPHTSEPFLRPEVCVFCNVLKSL